MSLTGQESSTPLLNGAVQEQGLALLSELLLIGKNVSQNVFLCEELPIDFCERALETAKGKNRNISRHTVEMLARMMQEGQWCSKVGNDIHFHTEGWLANGQHRLAAAVKTGIPLKNVLVHIGLTNNDILAIDTHRKRSVSDNAIMSGITVPNKHTAFSIVTARLQYLSGDIGFRKNITDFEKRDEYVANKFYIDEAVKIANNTSSKSQSGIPTLQSVYGGVISLCLEKNEEKTRAFCDAVKKGTSLSRGDPELAFRTFVYNNQPKGSFWNRAVFGQALFHALNAFFNNKKLIKIPVWEKGENTVDLKICPILPRNKTLLD